ncbi:MAG: endonuclease [Paludibacteraceae bacterium]|nr:endonuclease [Paludibacteraceae bacterium]
MKYFGLSLAVCVSCAIAFAEPIPHNYYAGAQGKKDAELKTALHKIVKGGVRYEYGTTQYHSSSNPPEWEVGDLKAFGTWQAFPLTDIHANGTVWDMYSNVVRYYPALLGESGCALNIEHCFPKSWWGGANNDAYKDLYHLNPSDAEANQLGKNAYPLGVVDSIVQYENGSCKRGYMRGHRDFQVFEPSDSYKGDFARAWFYIVTAYEDFAWQSEYMDNTSYLEFKSWLMNVLLKWHRNDPVSRKEINRADVISSIQHNRNPFIDYPDLVEYIWGNKKGNVVDFSQLISTDSPAYQPKEDKTDFFALPASNVTNTSFDTQWSDYNTTYIIDVYTHQITGQNDTIVNLPGVTQRLVESTPYGHIRGKVQSNGSQSITMGSGTTDGAVVLSGLRLSKDAQLVFRASQYNTAESAKMEVYGDTKLLRSISSITRNEKVYRTRIPAGTDSVIIASVGGSTKKRACMQELYLIQGDREDASISIEGYPQEIDVNSAHVEIINPLPQTTYYYRVTTQKGSKSNEVAVVLGEYEAIECPNVVSPVYKRVIDGQLYIVRGDKAYTLQGIAVNLPK